MPNAIDISEDIYHKLTVINEVLPRQRPRLWNCLCECGNTTQIAQPSLRTGKTKSCGCLHMERVMTHGDSKSRLFSIWQSMKQRCNNPKANAYSEYGGSGIKICNEWENSYVSFKDWALANGYSDSLTIDRKNGVLGYSPNNCRWATRSTQARNKVIKTNGSCEYIGVTKTKNSKFQAATCIDNKRVYIGTFVDAIDAAHARDKYLIELGLSDFTLNFIEEYYNGL